MGSNDRPDEPGEHGMTDSEQFDRIVTEYVDRLNGGEELNPFEILAAHPEHGADILRHLEAYTVLESDTTAPLGTLGDYTLRRQIGRGGMGVVYDAWQNSLDRQVALKVLPAGVAADTKATSRFLREAQVAARLNHPQVVSVYGFGVEQSSPYFAMEYVEGETLAQILQSIKGAGDEAETPFGAKKGDQEYFLRLARCCADVADGLQHAHAKGIIHRDVKPSNLILDEEGRLRILDFGLARLEGQESLTASGDFVGTPLYMSPEQARARTIPVDHRTDVYSLGATMYEMLTWRPPFKGKDHHDTLSQIMTRDPQPLRRLNPRIPRDLETITLKCLRKERDDRYGTAEALAQDLRRFARGDPIEARPPSAWEAFARRLWRHRAVAVGAAAIVAVALVALSVSTALISHERTLLREQRDETYRNLYLSHMRQAQQDWEEGQIGRLYDLLEIHFRQPNSHDVRGWEWHYLLSLCLQVPVTCHGHTATVKSVAWSPDGKHVASAGYDETVRIWNGATGQEERILRGHGSNVRSVAWSPDSCQLASSGVDRTIKIWDAAAGVLIRTIFGHTGTVFSVAWSPDGTRLASGSADGTVGIWEAETGKQLLSLKAHERGVRAVAWRPDGKRLASSPMKKPYALKIWNPDTGEPIASLSSHRGRISALSWSPDGTLLAASSFDRYLSIWDVEKGKERWWKRHRDAVLACAWSPDGTSVASVSTAQRIRIWDAEAEKEVLSLRGHTDWIEHLAWSPDSERLVSCSRDRTVRIWDVRENQEGLTLDHPPHPVVGVSWSPKGLDVASVGSSHLKIWDGASGDLRRDVPGNRCLAWHPEGRYVAVGSLEPMITIWDAEAGEKARTLATGDKRPDRITWSSDGRRLAILTADSVKVWDAWSGEKVLMLAGSSSQTGTVSWCPTSDRLATTYWENIIIWDATTGEPLQTMRGHAQKHFLASLAWSSDGRRLASGGADQTVKVWEPLRGAELLSLRGHTGDIDGLAWSPDADRLASASKDGTVRIWDTAGGRELLVLQGSWKGIFGVSWSRDGRRLAAAGHDGSVKVWDASSGYDQASGAAFAQERARRHYDRSVSLARSGRVEESSDAFRTARSIDRGSAQPLFERGSNYWERDLYAHALADLGHATELQPQRAAAHYLLAWLLATCPDVKLRDPQRAVVHARRAVELAPDYGEYWTALGAAYYRARRWKDSVTALERAMQLGSPGTTFDWLFTAMARWQQDDMETARRCYRRAVSGMSTHALTHRHEQRQRLQEEAALLLGITDQEARR